MVSSMANRRWSLVTAAVTIISVVALAYTFNYYQTEVQLHGETVSASEINILKQRLARKLLDIHEELNANYSTADIQFQLLSMVKRLDPGYNSMKHARQTQSSGSTGKVCKETYTSGSGFVIGNCFDDNAINSLVTLVCVTYNVDDDERVDQLYLALKNIVHSYKKLPIIIGANRNKKTKLPGKFVNGRISYFRSGSTLGAVLNNLISEVTTPYTLIATDIITHFTSDANLERQILVMSTLDKAEVAGGAFRNQTGHWRVGCFQTELRNYHLEYVEGYYRSDVDCMFCDYLQGPFVAKTSLLRKVPFASGLRSEAVIPMWFLELKQLGVLVVNCPDVMYFTWGAKYPGKSEKHSWLPVMKQLQTYRVLTPTNTLLEFSCEEVGLTCDPLQWVHSYMFPPCCFQQVIRTLQEFDLVAKENHISYRVTSGTALGAVKLRSYMPWDPDGDIVFDENSLEMIPKVKKDLRDKGFDIRPLSESNNCSFVLGTPDVKLDMVCGEPQITSLPDDLTDVPTKVNISGVWLDSEANPGLYVRSKYGPYILTHKQHCMFHPHPKSCKDKTGPGAWMPCDKPTHHACLKDHFPNDGSIYFDYTAKLHLISGINETSILMYN